MSEKSGVSSVSRGIERSSQDSLLTESDAERLEMFIGNLINEGETAASEGQPPI
jgi:hypothetical protein